MTSPADDCGVTGGCQACPLFTANVCGDPAPAEACDDANIRTGFHLPDGTFRSYPAAEWRARFEVTPAGVVTDRGAPDWAALVDAYLARELGEALKRRHPEYADGIDALVALANGAADPDAPDVDPAEPKPEGAGCCGGACSA